MFRQRTKLSIRIIVFALLGFSWNSMKAAQQTASTVEPPRTADLSFRHVIKNPAYKPGEGPVVLVDEAHNNFHTAVGTYLPFARLLEEDGYVIKRGTSKITNEVLQTGRIFVISDAQPPEKKGDPPTFSQIEIDTLAAWIHQGGSLLLITDHMPDPGAVAGLASALGIDMKNGYALNDHYSQPATPMIFKRKDGGVSIHPITEGRNPQEKIQVVATFTGTAFKAGPDFQPIMTIVSDKFLWMPEKLYEFADSTPHINVRGWYQGAAAKIGSGKVAVFAEAAMFTAQIFDRGRIKVGMNHPQSRDNAQLLLNVLHWLSDLI
jgi:hypothetical protein